MEIGCLDVVLCEFYFSDLKKSKRRPVLVFKDNLPYDDFIAIPISSQIEKMLEDELPIDNSNFKLGSIPKSSKVMIRKTFVVSKTVVVKKYGTLNDESYINYHESFCKYFGCKK